MAVIALEPADRAQECTARPVTCCWDAQHPPAGAAVAPAWGAVPARAPHGGHTPRPAVARQMPHFPCNRTQVPRGGGVWWACVRACMHAHAARLLPSSPVVLLSAQAHHRWSRPCPHPGHTAPPDSALRLQFQPQLHPRPTAVVAGHVTAATPHPPAWSPAHGRTRAKALLADLHPPALEACVRVRRCGERGGEERGQGAAHVPQAWFDFLASTSQLCNPAHHPSSSRHHQHPWGPARARGCWGSVVLSVVLSALLC